MLVLSQGSSETLCEVWEQYKAMLHKWPGHGFDNINQIHIFKYGLQQQHKLLLDATTGGSIMSKNVASVIKIIESMVVNSQKSEYNKGNNTKKLGILEPETNDVLLAQRKLLLQKQKKKKKKRRKERTHFIT